MSVRILNLKRGRPEQRSVLSLFAGKYVMKSKFVKRLNIHHQIRKGMSTSETPTYGTESESLEECWPINDK